MSHVSSSSECTGVICGDKRFDDEGSANSAAIWVAPMSRLDRARHAVALCSARAFLAMTTVSTMTASRSTVARWVAPLSRRERVGHVALLRRVPALLATTTASTTMAARATCTSSSQCMGFTCDHNRFNDDDIQNNGCEMCGPTVAFELCEA
jgi:hypothetical protein